MAATDKKLIAYTRTLIGTKLQTLKTFGLPFSIDPNTTLNELHECQALVEPPAGVIPNMRYLALGNLGHRTVVADDGSDETDPIKHRARDMGLFGQIPLSIRELDNDLTDSERERFALRVIEPHNGVQCAVYYLYRLDISKVVVVMNTLTVIDGETKTDPFVPTRNDLNPKRPVLGSEEEVNGSNVSDAVSAILDILLDDFLVREVVNAHFIRTGSSRSPAVSEFALCSAADRVVQGAGVSGTFNYTEAVAVQVNVHISTYHPLGYATDGVAITVDVGGGEPRTAERGVVGA